MLSRAARLYTLSTAGLLRQRASSAPGVRFVRQLHQTSVTRDMPKFDMNNPTLRKIQDNPRVLAAMSSAMQLLQSKGFVDPANPKPPSFMKMMQMMGDPEIKEKFMAVQQVMKEEGVSFSPADISAFMSGAGMAPGSGGGGRDDLDMKEPTNDASEDKKGLLGRISSSFKSKS